MVCRSALLLLALTAGALLLGAPAAQALQIILNPDPGLAANPAALAAFNRAAAQLENRLSDDVTVNIDAGLADLGDPNVIGSTSSVLLDELFDTVRDQMVADAATETDNAIVASLPAFAQFSAILPDGFGLDGNIAATKANLKAMGFLDLDLDFGPRDGTITFNSTFSFDFDNGDGVGSGLTDFETVALHELVHALGFVSVVDPIDGLVDSGASSDIAPNPLDLFRFGTAAGEDPSDAAEFTAFARVLLPGGEANFDDIDFLQAGLSTGLITGDGFQASHWKADALGGVRIGVMDPTISTGLFFNIAPTDLRALDVIGWDFVVPEPGTGLLLTWGLVGLVVGRRNGLAVRRRSGSLLG